MFNSDTELAKQIYKYLDDVLETSVELSVRTEEASYETYILVVASKFVRGKGVLAFRKLYTKEELLQTAFNSKNNNLCRTIWVDITNHLGA